MPKIFGLNIIAVILAAVVFFALGAVWYGVLFSDAWMAAHGIATEQAQDADAGPWMAVGFLITLAQVFGLGFVLRKADPGSFVGAAGIGLGLGLMLATPLMAYSLVYLPGHDLQHFAIDAAHLTIGWVLVCAILGLFKAWK